MADTGISKVLAERREGSTPFLATVESNYLHAYKGIDGYDR